MLGIGFSEVIIIALVCFIAFGPEELPKLMRKIAQLYRQFLNLKEELSFQMLTSEDNKSETKIEKNDG